ncbi:hypothetical protein MKX01_030330 [Papaver californicum]|nr:hypothetical protein MKX01_030330 [Papaver californicum]
MVVTRNWNNEQVEIIQDGVLAFGCVWHIKPNFLNKDLLEHSLSSSHQLFFNFVRQHGDGSVYMEWISKLSFGCVLKPEMELYQYEEKKSDVFDGVGEIREEWLL